MSKTTQNIKKAIPFFLVGFSFFYLSPTYALTLNEAIQTALARHPMMASSNANIEQAKAQERQAFGSMLPEITLRGDASNYQYTFSNSATANERPLQYRVEIRQPIFKGGRLYSAYKEKGLSYEQSLAEKNLSEQELLTELIQTYINAIYNKDVARLHHQQKNITKRAWKLMQEAFQAKQVLATDVNEHEERYINAKVATSNATNAYLREVNYLELLLDKEHIEHMVWPETSEPLSFATLDETVDYAEKHHPKIIEKTKNISIMKERITQAKGVFMPDVSVVAYHSGGDDRLGGSGQLSTIDKEQTVMAEFSMPLFSGGKNYYGLSKARADLRKARSDLLIARQDISREIQSLWYDYKQAEESLREYTHNIKTAKHSVKNYQISYKAGESTVLDMISAEELLIDVRIKALGAKKDKLVAYYNLLAAIGKLKAS